MSPARFDSRPLYRHSQAKHPTRLSMLRLLHRQHELEAVAAEKHGHAHQPAFLAMLRCGRTLRELAQWKIEHACNIGPRRNGIGPKRTLLHVVRRILPLQLRQYVCALGLASAKPAYYIALLRMGRFLVGFQSTRRIGVEQIVCRDPAAI